MSEQQGYKGLPENRHWQGKKQPDLTGLSDFLTILLIFLIGVFDFLTGLFDFLSLLLFFFDQSIWFFDRFFFIFGPDYLNFDLVNNLNRAVFAMQWFLLHFLRSKQAVLYSTMFAAFKKYIIYSMDPRCLWPSKKKSFLMIDGPCLCIPYVHEVWWHTYFLVQW